MPNLDRAFCCDNVCDDGDDDDDDEDNEDETMQWGN